MKSTFDLWRSVLAATVATCVVLSSAGALQDGDKKDSDETKPSSDEKGDAKKKDEEKEEWFAVVNGDVYTGTGALIRDCTVLAKNGVIEEIGVEVQVPDEAVVLDAGGLRVYPGLVAYASSGLMGFGTSDFQDTINPFSQNVVLALANGITSTGVSGTALKLRRGEIDDVVMREKYLLPVAYSSSNPQSKRSLEEKLASTAKYLRAYREWEEKKKEDKDLKEPAKKDVDSQILQMLKGEVLPRFNADGREELLGIARLAQKYGFRPVIEGCQEGWTIADELGRAGAIAIVTPRDRRDKSEELVAQAGTSIENAAILHRHGVQVAIVPAVKGVDLGGISGRDILALPIEAGFAVRGGLSDAVALQAITLIPARALGVEHRVGSIEVGKDCDLLVADGDLLHYQTFVQQAVVAGKVVYEKNKETFYAHIRPRSESQLAPEKRVDKGQEPEATTADDDKDASKGDDAKKNGDDDEDEDEKDKDGKDKKKDG